MNRGLKITGIVAAILFVIVGLWSVDNFYYPFKSVSPNYADVERAFARLQFPADWKEISSSENKGLFGRDCDPFNDSGCFHKSKTFSFDNIQTANIKIKEIFISQGCLGVSENMTYEGNSNTSPKTVTELYCQVQPGLMYRASTSQLKREVSVSASTF